MQDDLNRLFFPRGIAVIGASPRKKWDWSCGNSWIAGSTRMVFQGAIYPVHPTADTVLGYKAYPSVLDIPGEVDLAVFTIPLEAVNATMQQCVEKGVKYFHLLTAGFAETGLENGAEAETRLVDMARQGGARIIGPNCMGVYCPQGGLSWTEDFPAEPGTVGLFSQSGQIAYHIIRKGANNGLRFSKVVSFGNGSDLKAHDFLSYLARDQDTRVIAAYLEGLKDGRAFLEAARLTTPNKPLVVWKGGQTEGGSRATLSHTSAVAGSQRIWDAMCAQSGIVQVYSEEEMVFTLRAFLTSDLPEGAKVALLGGAGGGSVTTTDFAEKEGLEVPALSQTTISGLRQFIPVHGTSVKNPLDILPYIRKKENLLRVMELLKQDPCIDALIMNLSPGWVYRELGSAAVNGYLARVLEAKKALGKPAYLVLSPEDDPLMDLVRKQAMQWLSEAGASVFPAFRLAARAVRAMKEYRAYLRATAE